MFYDVTYYDDYGYEPNLKDGWHITVEEIGAYSAVRKAIRLLGNCEPNGGLKDEFLKICKLETSDDDVICTAYRISDLDWDIHLVTSESEIESNSIINIPVRCLCGDMYAY